MKPKQTIIKVGLYLCSIYNHCGFNPCFCYNDHVLLQYLVSTFLKRLNGTSSICIKRWQNWTHRQMSHIHVESSDSLRQIHFDDY